MKSKEEILSSYYVQGADGMPEIAAGGLLKAMDEYRLQAEKAAFDAARLYMNEVIGGRHLFETFEDYRASLVKKEPVLAKSAEAETIQIIADSILEQFIPNDPDQKTLTFRIRTNGMEYTADYEKNTQGNWSFAGYSNA